MGMAAGLLNYMHDPLTIQRAKEQAQLQLLRAAAQNPGMAGQMGFGNLPPPPVAPQPGQASVPMQQPQATPPMGTPPPPTAAPQPQQPQGWQGLPKEGAAAAPQGVAQPQTQPQGTLPLPPSVGGQQGGFTQPQPAIPPQARTFQGFMQEAARAGIPQEQAIRYYQESLPYIQAQEKQELEQYKLQIEAKKAAQTAWNETMSQARLAKGEESLAKYREFEESGKGKEQILEGKDGKMYSWNPVTNTVTPVEGAPAGLTKVGTPKKEGVGSGLQKTEFIYPKGADGRPDETQAPIGVRGVTKDGKVVTLDNNGNPVKNLEGGTAKEARDTKASAVQAVRQSIVKSGVTNSLARLDEIDKKFGDNVTTSAFFGQHGDNPLTRGLYGSAKGMQGKKQQEADADWASFIDEAIPVFTGGLRGSDAFRRFLIEQAPGPGDKPETVKEKKRLFRQNIEGTSKAFFNKFSADPTMWAAGTKPEDVSQASTGAKPQTGEWKVEKVQ